MSFIQVTEDETGCSFLLNTAKIISVEAGLQPDGTPSINLATAILMIEGWECDLRTSETYLQVKSMLTPF